ncbi:MAG: hypothetical protein LH603_15420 [Pseudonocardia sp.]|nr:hypothetical protein [Pseudonocardia sp.]
MTVQIAVKLDDGLAEQVGAAAGTNLSEWVRVALQREATWAKAMRAARAEEDARSSVYTDRTVVGLSSR